MISMYAEYSGRTLYVCLSTDNNADDFKGAKNGDIMYHMDTGKKYVYNAVDKAFHELPEEGGGGTLIEKTITENGIFTAADDGADGYSSVITDVTPAEFTLIVNNNLNGSSGTERNAMVFTSRKPMATPGIPLYQVLNAPGRGSKTTVKIPGNPLSNNCVIVIRTRQAATITLPSNMNLMLTGNDIQYPNLYAFVLMTKVGDAATSYEITINPAS